MLFNSDTANDHNWIIKIVIRLLKLHFLDNTNKVLLQSINLCVMSSIQILETNIVLKHRPKAIVLISKLHR